MITKEQFFKFVANSNKYEEEIDKIYDMFKLEIWETPLCLAAAECMDLFVDSNFTTAGINMVNWWLYEDADKVIFSDSEEPIDISRLEDFWNYLVENKDTYMLP